ncbi:nitroreductase/quinone reductase family protein [Kutzneria chonburiensis]|uniref:Nitroreductase/quinone reductase family protein n=1 Tax=Kutzneria chonburiensis TaxID=1483604 RepID=A0ABV6MSE0_9PSEU|nr:nitroreductase/quinone reductase family protein [Kutzneria chonburiensis]
MTEIDFIEINRQVVAEFRTNGGKGSGMVEGYPIVLVHHRGARSGIERVTPLVPYVEGDRIFIFASKGGSPEHPAWFHNLVAHPETEAEYGTERFPVVARVLTGTERDDVYAKHSALQPQFADYQQRTERLIPVIELQRV